MLSRHRHDHRIAGLDLTDLELILPSSAEIRIVDEMTHGHVRAALEAEHELDAVRVEVLRIFLLWHEAIRGQMEIGLRDIGRAVRLSLRFTAPDPGPDAAFDRVAIEI